MCRFIETIQVKNRALQRIAYHNRRFNAARSAFFRVPEADLQELVTIPDSLDNSVYRCRIEYASDIIKTEFFPYQPRKINTLKLVACNNIDYSFKYADRKRIDELFANRGNCDEIVIVRNGLITDTSIANLIFSDGVHWHTPLQPLLKGTHRQRLIDENLIREAAITPDDLSKYTHLRTINAMLDDSPPIPVANIIH